MPVSASSSSSVQLPKKLGFLFESHRYKVAYGGRGASKSWGFARGLLIKGAEAKRKILCSREIQKSIADSVHALLASQIKKMGLGSFYTVQNTSIFGKNGTEFLFAGLKHNINNIKSLEDVDIAWVEEAQSVSKASWEVLIPTIRKAGSEIWVSFNPELETDDTYQRFVVNPPPSAKVVKINWPDNPWFTDVLRQEKDHLLAKDPAAYAHVWEGQCRQMVEGAIYREQLIAAEAEGRITSVPYDATQPVHTFWDLGFGDSVSIWLVQVVGFEFHLIDFIEGSQADIQHYLKALQDKPYVYGTHYLPHDARAKTLAAGGRSIEQQIQAGGRKVEIVRNMHVADGIAAARAIFNRCYFDKTKCADGLQALRHYRYAVDENLSLPDKQVFKKEPVHDWSSHPADAFRYFAVAIKEPQRKREAVAVENPYGADGWMA